MAFFGLTYLGQHATHSDTARRPSRLTHEHAHARRDGEGQEQAQYGEGRKTNEGTHRYARFVSSVLVSLSPLTAGPKKTFAGLLHSKNINDISDATLRAAYARTEKLQPEGNIGIDEIRILLSYVYEGLPPEREIALLTKYCDLYNRGPQLPGEGAEGGILIRVTIEEFMKAVAQVRIDTEESDTFKHIAGVKQGQHTLNRHTLNTI